jgi:hypothetical protein
MASLLQFTSVVRPFLALLNSTAETTATPDASFIIATQNETASTGPLQMSSDFVSLFAFISYFSAFRVYLKFVVLVGVFEALRRLYSASYSNFVDHFFITATFESEDHAFREHSSPYYLSLS